MDIPKFIRDIVGLADWTRPQKEIDALVSSGDWATCRRLGHALGSAPAPAESLSDRLIDGLALTPGEEPALLAVELGVVGRGKRAPARQLMARIAQSQSTATAVVVAAKLQTHPDTAACLVHECILRGKGSTALAALVPVGHPLRGLPPSLIHMEEELKNALPSYGLQSTGFSAPFGPTAQDARGGRRVDGTWLPEDARIAAAVQGWQSESNGVIEAVVLRLDADLDAREFGAESLRSFLHCLDDATRVSAQFIAPSRAAHVLFAAACNGGAYGGRLGGAYGRLALWESMAGLTGAATGAAVVDIMRLAESSSWFLFDADGSWFQDVAWDLGLAVIRPDRRTVAAVAATDTD